MNIHPAIKSEQEYFEEHIRILQDAQLLSNPLYAYAKEYIGPQAPHTFRAGGYVFGVFYSGLRDRDSLIGLLAYRIQLLRVKLAQLIFPDSSWFCLGVSSEFFGVAPAVKDNAEDIGI